MSDTTKNPSSHQAFCIIKLGTQAIIRAAEREGRISPGRLHSLSQFIRRVVRGMKLLDNDETRLFWPTAVTAVDEGSSATDGGGGLLSMIATAVKPMRRIPRLKKGVSLVHNVEESFLLLILLFFVVEYGSFSDDPRSSFTLCSSFLQGVVVDSSTVVIRMNLRLETNFMRPISVRL